MHDPDPFTNTTTAHDASLKAVLYGALAQSEFLGSFGHGHDVQILCGHSISLCA